MKKMILWVTLATILSTSGACSAMAARDPHWKSHYQPPYQGVQHTIYSIENRDPFAGTLEIDLPATLMVDTCLLPWDLLTLAIHARDPKEKEPESTRN